MMILSLRVACSILSKADMVITKYALCKKKTKAVLYQTKTGLRDLTTR